MRLILLLASLGLVPILALGESENDYQGRPVQSTEELENYQFDEQPEAKAATVKDLNIGQKFILDSHRQNIKDLMTRRLGIVTIKQDLGDLKKIQQAQDEKKEAEDEKKKAEIEKTIAEFEKHIAKNEKARRTRNLRLNPRLI